MKLSPQEFWRTCEEELSRSVEPAKAQLQTLASNSLAQQALLDQCGHLLNFPAHLDVTTLQSTARALRAWGSKLQAPSSVKGEIAPIDAPLHAGLAEATAKASSVAVALADSIEAQARSCTDELARCRSQRASEEALLAQQAQTLSDQAANFSKRALGEAAQQIKAIEAAFNASSQISAALPPPGQVTVRLHHMLLAAGGIALVVALALLWKSGPLAIATACIGASLILFGAFRLKVASPRAIATSSEINNTANLRAQVRKVSAASEEEVRGYVAPIKAQLSKVHAAVAGLAEKERAEQKAIWFDLRERLQALRSAEGESLARLARAMHSICAKRQRLAEEADAALLSSWKTKVSDGAMAISAAGAAAAPASEPTAQVGVGAATFKPPVKVSRFVNAQSIQIPYSLNLEVQGIRVRALSSAAELRARALLVHIVLALTVASRGRVRLRLWDPRNFGAGFTDILPLAEKAMTAFRELSDTLEELRATAAARQVRLAKYRPSPWSELLAKPDAAASDAFEVLLISEFPAGFNEIALEHLASLARAGQKVGIFVLVEESATALQNSHEGLRRLASNVLVDLLAVEVPLEGPAAFAGQVVELAAPDRELLAHAHVAVTNLAEYERSRIEHARLIPDLFFDTFHSDIESGLAWGRKAADGISVRLGTAVTGREGPPVTIDFDDNTAHALLVGSTGSGKSNLLHSVIQGIALAYSPDEVTFYLADLKDGVEFASYTRGGLPHATAIAATKDPRYAVALVKAANTEISLRNKKFRDAGATNYKSFRKMTSAKLPRILLIIDEFQALFENRESSLAVRAELVNLCKQGRSAGIHVLLATQAIRGRSEEIGEVLGQVRTRVIMKAARSDALSATGNAEMAARIATFCTKPGQGCIDKDAGSGQETYFQNPRIRDDHSWFFARMSHQVETSGTRATSPVVWSDEAREIKDNSAYVSLPDQPRLILLGEPYSLAHAVGFRLSSERSDWIAIATDSPEQQSRIIFSIATSAMASCGDQISIDFVRSPDAVLNPQELQSLVSRLGSSARTRVLPGSQIAGALAEPAPDGLHFLCILGISELSLPKKFYATNPPFDPNASLTDIDLIIAATERGTNSGPHLIFCCNNPAIYTEQLAMIRERISVRIFGYALPGSRAREFAALSDLPDMARDDLCLVVRGSAPTVFKSFVGGNDGVQA